MKQGWTYKKLGEVADVIHGKNQKEVISEDGIYPIYGSGGNIMGYAKDYLCEAGTTILGRKGTINNPLYIKERFWNVDTAFGITAKEGNESKYLYYYIKNIDWLKKNTGTTLPSLTQQVVKSVVLPVPTLSEQQRIVKRLDSAFAHIDELKANAEKQLSEARKLFQKALAKAMEPKEGWEEKTLKEIAKYRRGSFPQPYGNKEWYDGEGSMPFVQVAELQEDSFELVPKTKRRISKIAQPLSVFVPAGTVLVSLQGSIGKVSITDYDSYVDRTIAIFQDYKISINKIFFAYQLKIRFEIERLKARGTTIKTITKEEFANFIINFPPLPEQQRIVSRLDSLAENVKKLEENQRKVMAECDALKQALLRKVFE